MATGDFTWDSQNFAGFYYDIDHDVGTETLTATPRDNKLSGDYPCGLVYETTMQETPFKFKDWGSYNVIGFLGEKCFAGYIEGSNFENGYLFEKSAVRSSISNGQIERILLDDDKEITITSSSPMKLKEGYVLSLKDIDISGNDVYLDLLRNGVVVDSRKIQPSKQGATIADRTYYYRNSQLGDQNGLVTIAVHFKNAFRGADTNIATVDGEFQISETAISLKTGQQYDKMTIGEVDVNSGSVTMENRGYPITLSRNRDTLLMGGISLKTADSKSLRYFIHKPLIRDLGIDEEQPGHKSTTSNEASASPFASSKQQTRRDESHGTAVPADTQQAGYDQLSVTSNEPVTRTIGPEGGSIYLGDGIKIIFPEGSVDKDMEVSASIIDPSTYLEDDLYEGVVISVDNQGRELNKPAEIRVPLPSYIGRDDENQISAGTIDESTGALIEEDCHIEVLDGGVEAVLSADHFSNKYLRWIQETLLQEPLEYGPLTVPYYEQGGPWCWAASTLMLCQAARLKEDAQVFDVIGKTGIDETGLEDINVLGGYVQEHTSLSAQSETWKIGSQFADRLRTYIRKQLAFKHNPVMVLSSKKEHAWVVVGYDGDMFYVHDPQDPAAMPPYTKISWGNEDEGLCKLWTVESVATMVVPDDISSKSYPVSLNLLGEGELSFNEINPKIKHRTMYPFKWTNSRSGYSIFTPGDGERLDALPADITELSVGGISIANPDRKSARQVTVSIEVMDQMEKNKNKFGTSQSKTITVQPASVAHLTFDAIPVSNFYIDGVNKYKFMATAREGGKQVAKAVFFFEFKASNWKIWEIVPGTDTRLDGISGITDFTYVVSQSGSTMTFTGTEGLFPDLDIVGTISGKTFTGTFIDHDPKSPSYGKTHGKVDLTFSDDGNHFTGTLMDEDWSQELEWGGDKQP